MSCSGGFETENRMPVASSTRPFSTNAHIQLIPSPCKAAFEDFLAGVTAELHVVTPSFPRAAIQHLPRVHAKLLVADRAAAIIGSANLTAGGLENNYEYGLRLSSPDASGRIADHVDAYSTLAGVVTSELLASYSEAAATLRAVFLKRERAISASVTNEFTSRVRTADDLLLRARVRGGVTSVFARTILFLLRAGPVKTVELHPKIKTIHPDLCDDSVD